MDVFGVREALSGAHGIRLPGETSALLVSYPALVVLKIVAWNYRHLRQPKKDATDIELLLRSYLEAEQQHRLWDEFGKERLLSILESQTSTDVPGVLPSDMGDEDRARSLFLAIHKGLH